MLTGSGNIDGTHRFKPNSFAAALLATLRELASEDEGIDPSPDF
jgi:hypothetical protein